MMPIQPARSAAGRRYLPAVYHPATSVWENTVMFLVTCEIVGRTGLVWPSDLVSIANTDAGIVVRYRCLCGDEAAMLTGAGSQAARPVHLGSAA
jgi:hypothetical protein